MKSIDNMAEFPFTFEENTLPDPTLLRIKPGGCVVPTRYKDHAPKLYNMELRKDDVWLLSFVKTGTTWVGELLWAVVNDFDLETANRIVQCERYCHPGYDPIVHWYLDSYKLKCEANGLEVSQKLLAACSRDFFQEAACKPSPRLLGVHYPLDIIPPALLDTCKAIYITRNPMDTCVSFFHYFNNFADPDDELDFETFFRRFLADELLFCPYLKNVRLAWEKRDHPNLLFLFYEEMKSDLVSVINKVAAFLGKSPTEEQMRALCKHLSMEEMKKNPTLNNDVQKDLGVFRRDFIRKGVVGDYKNYMTAEMQEEMKKWWGDYMEGCDIKFPGFDLL